MRLKDIAQKNNNRILAERSLIQARKPVSKQTSPLEKQQNITSFQVGRILKGVFQNEQRMNLLSELMFLVVSASLNDSLIRKAAKLKFQIGQGAANANRRRKKRR
jgi:hypothetical protein